MVKTRKTFTEGPLFSRIFLFTVPLMLTAILQVLYNMADNIVVGRFSGDEYALAAVGSTSSMMNLIINFFIGISVGAGVVVAQEVGAKRDELVSRTVHTSMLFSVFGGIFLMILGLLVSRPALTLIGVKEVFIEKSILYFRIICLGIPGASLYNFGASILRSVGDSKTPLIILSLSGMANVLLNLLFVIVFKMSVAGVAVATIISQYLSAIAVVCVLMLRKNENYALRIKELKIDKNQLSRVLRIGVPSGLQGAMFNISNVFLASGINTFSPETVTANTIAANVDNITYVCINSFSQSTLTFVGQNCGANKPDRIIKTLIYAMIQAVCVGIVISNLEMIFANELGAFFIDSNVENKGEVLDIAVSIMRFILLVYPICGIMDVFSGALRGLGYSVVPMIITIFGVCVVRIVWVLTVFKLESFHTILGLYLCYPITWIIATVAMIIAFAVIITRMKKQKGTKSQNQTA